MSSQEESERLDRFRKLCEEREELWREYSRDFRPYWAIDFGRFQIPVRLGSTGFAWLYAGLNIALGAFGVICVFLGQSWRALGIALIVGALFGIGALVGQVMSIQMNEEIHRGHLLWADARLQEYAARRNENDEQLRVLRDESEEIAEQMRALHIEII